jgi:hypothetical protein
MFTFMWFVYIFGCMFTFSDCLRAKIGRDVTGFDRGLISAITDLSNHVTLFLLHGVGV